MSPVSSDNKPLTTSNGEGGRRGQYADDENQERGNWSGRMDFVLSLVGSVLKTSGNVFFNPIPCHSHWFIPIPKFKHPHSLYIPIGYSHFLSLPMFELSFKFGGTLSLNVETKLPLSEWFFLRRRDLSANLFEKVGY